MSDEVLKRLVDAADDDRGACVQAVNTIADLVTKNLQLEQKVLDLESAIRDLKMRSRSR